jgi:hypothetical protein
MVQVKRFQKKQTALNLVELVLFSDLKPASIF